MTYRPLKISPAQPATTLPSEKYARPNKWMESDAAIVLMTDFRDSSAPLIASSSQLGDASIEMQRLATSALLATDGEGVAGIITLHDILGPKPVQFLHDAGCHQNCRREDVTVADVMTPVALLPTVRLSDLQRSHIGDVRLTFEHTTHTHLMVLDDATTGLDVICGMIDKQWLEHELHLSPGRHPADGMPPESFARESVMS